MWNLKNWNNQQTKVPKNPYVQEFFSSNKKSVDHPQKYTSFDVRKQYLQIKENHPFYQQLHKPTPNPVKYSYLDQLAKGSLTREEPLKNLSSYLTGKSQLS